LLENPCEQMSKYEFFEAVYTFLYSCGEAFILKERPALGVNAGLTAQLIILYPANIVIKVTDTLPRKVAGYDYVVDGYKVYENIPVEDMIHIKYFNPSMDFNGSELRGLSPLKALAKRLTAMDANIDTVVAQMQNGGVETIVYEKGELTDGAREIIGSRKDNFYRFLKDPSNARMPYFAVGEMGAIPIGLSNKDLQVLEQAKFDFKKLCNAYGVSDILFNNDSASTESNVNEMTKRLYTNAVLPNVYRVKDALKMALLPEFEKGAKFTSVNEIGEMEVVRVQGDNKKRDLQVDITEIPELQEDMKQMADIFAALPVIIPNKILEAFKYEVSTDPLMDKAYIKTS
jgi:HK97 family phage portal protein